MASLHKRAKNPLAPLGGGGRAGGGGGATLGPYSKNTLTPLGRGGGGGGGGASLTPKNTLTPILPLTCKRCNKTITGDSVIRHGAQTYHPKCFTCHRCRRSIRDTKVYYDETACELFCEKCYLRSLPRCAMCKREIMSEIVSLSPKYKFHPQCFVCYTCRQPLKEFYELHGKRYCRDDYLLACSPRCAKCNQMIAPDDQNNGDMENNGGGGGGSSRSTSNINNNNVEQQRSSSVSQVPPPPPPPKSRVIHHINYENANYHPNCFVCDQCGGSLDAPPTPTQSTLDMMTSASSANTTTTTADSADGGSGGASNDTTTNTNTFNKLFYPINGEKLCKDCAILRCNESSMDCGGGGSSMEQQQSSTANELQQQQQQ